MAKKKVKFVEFFEPQVWEREWGEEILVAHVPGLYTGKVFKMKAGKRGGLQYHRKKNEAGYLYSGEMLLEYDAGDGAITKVRLTPGSSVHIPPGAVHRQTAITDCIYFEVSNPVFNDRVRVEDRYGEKIVWGLPTTEEKDIKIG